MPQISRTISLTGAPATITSTTDYAYVNVPEGAVGAFFRVSSGTASGTSPTLNVYVQHGFRTPSSDDIVGRDVIDKTAIDDDFISFTQITASNKTHVAAVLASGEEMYESADRALTAGQIRNGPLPPRLRVSAVVGGTNPSFANFSVIAEFIF